MYVASLYPDRISVRYDNDSRSVQKKWEDKMTHRHANSLKNLTVKKSSWRLSYQSRRKIRDSISYLSQMSKPRTVTTPRGKLIYNFKTAFITLTLPSPQVHTDIEIKACLNNFLTTMRGKFGLKNYVWKAELQENKSIHFHIIWDIYIHHTIVRYYWNKALNVLGYVDRYCEKFSKLSLSEYASLRGIPVSKAVSGFLFGRNTNWRSPGTEQVKAIQNNELIGYYVSKYVAKDVAESEEVSEDVMQRILNFGRIWGRSQSLSSISFVTRYCWTSLESFLRTVDADFKSFLKMEYDYCTVFYFDFNQATKAFRRWLRVKMQELAVSYRYPIPA